MKIFRKYTDESAWVYQAAEDLGSSYYTGKVRQIFIGFLLTEQ